MNAPLLQVRDLRVEFGQLPAVRDVNFDVLGAETALIRARTNELQALYDNTIAQAELKLATGTL